MIYVWLNLKTIQFYIRKLSIDFYWQPSYLLGERASLLEKTCSPDYKKFITEDILEITCTLQHFFTIYTNCEVYTKSIKKDLTEFGLALLLEWVN